MNTLFILNDLPCGNKRSYSGLGLAVALAKHDAENLVTLFQMANAVCCAKKGQKTREAVHFREEPGPVVRHMYG
jgi:sulfur relay (sulfurtransferase) complex TusBCD TusD component (DsrE family)